MIRAGSRASAAIVLFALAGGGAARAEAPAPDVRALGSVRADAAALLSRGGDGGALKLALATAPLGPAGAGGATPVLLVAELEGATLLAGHPGGRLGVEFAVYALAADGAIRASRSDGVALDVTPGDEIERTGLRILAKLELPAGETSVRVFARVRQTGAFALRETKVRLPASVTPDAPAAPSAAGEPKRWIDALAPGLERSELAALEAAGGIPFGGSGEIDPSRATATAAILAPMRGTRTRDVEALAAAYLAGYRLLAAGDRGAAVAALVKLEERTLELDRAKGMGRLAGVEGPLLADLSERSPGSLLPLALLYQELFRAHLVAEHHGLARRAAAVAEELLLRSGQGARDADGKRLAANGLDGLAADYLEIRSPVRAAALLERATGFDPSRTARWLALATIREQSHRLDDAKVAVDRALALEPRHREARLRRARLARVGGDGRRAAQEFDALLAESDRDWVAIVAAEERARQLIDERRLPAAAGLLARESERFPDEPALATVLAWTRIRTGARTAALDAAERAARADRAQGVSPRRRYSEPPLAALIAARSEVESAALLALDELGSALPAAAARARR